MKKQNHTLPLFPKPTPAPRLCECGHNYEQHTHSGKRQQSCLVMNNEAWCTCIRYQPAPRESEQKGIR